MKNLLLILTLFLPLIINAQYNYQKPVINVHNTWEIPPPTGYWKHYESRQLLNTGLILTGMTGLAFYFDTLADGPYKPLGYFYGGIATGKFIHAGIVRKREKSYDKWRRRLH